MVFPLHSKTKELDCIEILRDYIDNIENNVGWWYALPLSGTGLDYELLHFFPNVNHIFGTHQDAMTMFWLQAKWFKRHGASGF